MSKQIKHDKWTTVKKLKERASYDLDKVLKLVNDVKTGHIGFVAEDKRPMIIPFTVWADDEFIYFHLLNKSKVQKILEAGKEVCLSVAETSEWVLAKSAYAHSANYRSAVLYCSGQRVTDEKEFNKIFANITNQLEDDRYNKLRKPNKSEIKQTALMKLTINTGSFKQRSAGVSIDENLDAGYDVNFGLIPACPCKISSEDE